MSIRHMSMLSVQSRGCKLHAQNITHPSITASPATVTYFISIYVNARSWLISST